MEPLRLSEEDSRRLAKHVVETMVTTLSHEETVAALVGLWGKYLDQWIGRNFRRLVLYVIIVVVVTAAIRLQIWRYMFK